MMLDFMEKKLTKMKWNPMKTRVTPNRRKSLKNRTN